MAKTPRKRTRRVRKEPEVTALLVPAERIERSILLIRGEKVMLDADLAELYGVTTKRFNTSRSGATWAVSPATSCSSSRPRSTPT